ncbi:MAG: OmpA family protein [Candidatus Omnitrophota bacterium]
MMKTDRLVRWIALGSIFFFVTGCSFVFHKRSPADTRRIDELESEVSRLNRELAALEAIKRNLDNRLKEEIGKGQVTLKVEDRGVVLTSMAEVYFDSGKAKIRLEAKAVLQKIASALKDFGGSRNILIEGHTDNQPIRHSGWKSNQELSEARAQSVADYLVQGGIASSLVSTKGHADKRAVASNDTPEGRQKNRRVEIVIMSRDNLRKLPASQRDTIK